jgi:hypothetical protein
MVCVCIGIVSYDPQKVTIIMPVDPYKNNQLIFFRIMGKAAGNREAKRLKGIKHHGSW